MPNTSVHTLPKILYRIHCWLESVDTVYETGNEGGIMSFWEMRGLIGKCENWIRRDFRGPRRIRIDILRVHSFRLWRGENVDIKISTPIANSARSSTTGKNGSRIFIFYFFLVLSVYGTNDKREKQIKNTYRQGVG